MKLWQLAGLGLGLGLLAPLGCAAPTDGGTGTAEAQEIASNEDILPETVLTKLSVDETEITFYEAPGHGVIVIALAGPGASPPAELQQELSPVELYEVLSDSPAPLALVEAAEREAELAAQQDAAGAAVDEESPEDADATALDEEGLSLDAHEAKPAHSGNHSANQWVSEHCNSSRHDITNCGTNRTCGSNSCQLSRTGAIRAGGALNPYRGNARFRLQLKNFWGNWETISSLHVTQGFTVFINSHTSSFERSHRFHVLEGQGDGFHFHTYFDR